MRHVGVKSNGQLSTPRIRIHRLVGELFAFAVSIGLVMNLASKDCWYRANYGSEKIVESKTPLWGASGMTLLIARAASINSFWFLFAAAVLAARFISVVDRAPLFVLMAYAVLIPTFAITRMFVTLKHNRIPRRASWYR